MSNNRQWIFILGGSSGFGMAIAEKFSKNNFNIIIVHRDRRSKIHDIEEKINKLRANNIKVLSINTNAVTKEGRIKVFEKILSEFTNNDKIKLFVHSIADGNIGKISDYDAQTLENIFLHTINSMAISFVVYSRELIARKLFAENARIIGLTSEGGTGYMSSYSMVGAAKSVLENLCRSMAVEFSELKITTNLISPGVTKTNALNVLPDHKKLVEKAKKRNPFGELTSPGDVANVVWLLAQNEARWINGEIIRVDGGEQINLVING